MENAPTVFVTTTRAAFVPREPLLVIVTALAASPALLFALLLLVKLVIPVRA